MNESNAMALADNAMGAVDWDALHERSRAIFDAVHRGSSLALQSGLYPTPPVDPAQAAMDRYKQYIPLQQARGPVETIKDAFSLQKDEQGIPRAPGIADTINAALWVMPGMRGPRAVMAPEKGAGSGGGRPPAKEIGDAGGSPPPERINEAATSYNGKIYTGRLHSDAVDKIIKESGMTEQQFDREFKNMTHGFVTTNGRFLERGEAMNLTGATKPIHGDSTYMVEEKPLIRADQKKPGAPTGAPLGVADHVARLEGALGKDEFMPIMDALRADKSMPHQELLDIAKGFLGPIRPSSSRNQVLDFIESRHSKMMKFKNESERTGIGRKSAS